MTHDYIVDLEEHCESLDGGLINRDALIWYLRDGYMNVPGLPMFRGNRFQSPKKLTVGWDGYISESPISTLRRNLVEFVASRKDVGLLLSGGVDSNLCFQLLSESGLVPGRDFRCFHGVFENSKYREFDGIPSRYREFVELVNLKLDDEALLSDEFRSFLKSMMQPVNGLIAYLIFNTISYAKSQGIKHLVVPSLDVVFLQSEVQTRVQRVTKEGFGVTGGDGSYSVERADFVNENISKMTQNLCSFDFVFDKPEVSESSRFFYSIEPQLMFRRYPLIEFLQIGMVCGVEIWSPYNSKNLLRSISSNCNPERLWETAGKPLLRNYLLEKNPDFKPVSKVVTSPQREMLYNIIPFLVNRAKNGVLVDAGIVEPKMVLEYINNYAKSIRSIGVAELGRDFGLLNSNVLWRFFVTETWSEFG